MVMRMREEFKWTMGSHLSQVLAISNDPRNLTIWKHAFWETQLSSTHHLSNQRKFPFSLWWFTKWAGGIFICYCCHKIYFLYKCFHLFKKKKEHNQQYSQILSDFFNFVNYTNDIINNFNTKTMVVRWAHHPINGNRSFSLMFNDSLKKWI